MHTRLACTGYVITTRRNTPVFEHRLGSTSLGLDTDSLQYGLGIATQVEQVTFKVEGMGSNVLERSSMSCECVQNRTSDTLIASSRSF